MTKVTWKKLNLVGDEGGFGDVYEATKLINGIEQPEEYALKQLKVLDDDSVERFKREVIYLRKLDHPRIVKCEGMGLRQEPYFYTMNKYATSLSGVQKNITSDYKRIQVVYNNILDGIEYLHSEGYIHRDIKPGNVLYNTDNDIVLCDLGLGLNAAIDPEDRLTKTAAWAGTEFYTSPEQYESLKHVDIRTDIYSFGKMLYEVLTLTTPAVLQYKGIHPALASVIKKCTYHNKAYRYESVSELKSRFNMSMDIIINHFDEEDLKEKFNTILLTESDLNGNQLFTLIDILSEYKADEDELFELLMQLKGSVFKQLYKEDITFVENKINIMIDIINKQGWPFSYTDTIANKYEEIFKNVESDSIKERLLKSLLNLGVNHNRWYVMGVFVELLYEITDEALAHTILLELNDEKHKIDRVSNNISVDIEKLPDSLKKLFE